jgi:riboflavin synthase
MFTGLVKTLGEVIEINEQSFGKTIVVKPVNDLDTSLGDSVAVNGVCLTVVSNDDNLVFDVMKESLEVTDLGNLNVGFTVNLETSMKLSDLVGGHLVSGHVDFVSELLEISDNDYWFKIADGYEKYIVLKGSVTVNGVSLTVSGVEEDSFRVSLIPETLDRTNFRYLDEGCSVNVEIDLVARYLEKLV